MSGGAGTVDRVAALRDAFDRTFAAPPPAPAPLQVDVLAVRIGGDPYALRLDALGGLLADRTVTPFPSADPDFAGLAAWRGALVPVFALRGLLGYPPGVPARWLALAGARGAVAFAFDTYEGFVRVPLDALCAPESPARFLGPVVRTAAVARPLLDLAALLIEIERRAPRAPGRRSERR